MKLTTILFSEPVPVPGHVLEKRLLIDPAGFEVELSDGFLWLSNGTGVPLSEVRYVVRATRSVDVPRNDPPAGPPSPRRAGPKGGPKK